MRKIRVLVVDDSTVIRRLLSDSFTGDPQIEVAATAANGKIALAKIPHINPDVVTLDIEMPEMDGIATLVELRKVYPKLPVIMFSKLTHRGAEKTFDALSKGANDYVAKPANVGSVTAAMQSVRNELTPKIKALCPWWKGSISPSCQPESATKAAGYGNQRTKPFTPRNGLTERIDVVAIGASTGGPNALQTVVSQLPADFPVPIVLVQHMPPVFTKHLANRLNQVSQLSVFEGQQGDTIVPGGVWIAPGDFHMEVVRSGPRIKLDLNQGTPENSCRPAVNVLFRSVEKIYGGNVLAVVLTGMGEDGARGCQLIHDRGGRVLIQDQTSSVVWGMPGAVAHAGLADWQLPIGQIADQILRIVRRGGAALQPHPIGSTA